jgi:hypothetical protein
MWMDSSFARWEVEGEARERIKGAQREADQRRLARLARSGEVEHTLAGVVSAAVVVLQRLASRVEPKQRPAHP